jgi:hypothetical protein
MSCGGTLSFWQAMKRDRKFPPGAHVTWKWGEQILHGIVQKVFTHRIERTMKGATVTRDASKKNPAYLIQLDDGDDIFLSHSDLRSA